MNEIARPEDGKEAAHESPRSSAVINPCWNRNFVLERMGLEGLVSFLLNNRSMYFLLWEFCPDTYGEAV